MNYISLKSILLLVPKTIRENTDDDTILTYALNVYKTMQMSQRYDYKIAVVPIVNHRALLPEDLVIINQVSYQVNEPCQDDLIELNSCSEVSVDTSDWTPTPTEETHTGDQCTIINYRLWLDSTYYKRSLSPLKFIGNASGLFCKDCPNLACSTCKESFSLDVYSRSLLFQNIEDGYVCIDYVAEMKQNGEYLIPDDEDLKMGLALYAIAHCWRDRAYTKEEQAMNLYNAELSKAEIRLKKARGKFKLHALDVELLHSINFQNMRYLYLPQVTNLPTYRL